MSYSNKDATEKEDPAFLPPLEKVEFAAELPAFTTSEKSYEEAGIDFVAQKKFGIIDPAQILKTCERKKLARRFLLMVWHEFLRADSRFPHFASAHEGYAVALEEMDEVWDAIKHNGLEEACREMIQVGATSIRFLTDMEKHLKKPLPEDTV